MYSMHRTVGGGSNLKPDRKNVKYFWSAFRPIWALDKQIYYANTNRIGSHFVFIEPKRRWIKMFCWKKATLYNESRSLNLCLNLRKFNNFPFDIALLISIIAQNRLHLKETLLQFVSQKVPINCLVPVSNRWVSAFTIEACLLNNNFHRSFFASLAFNS